MDDGRFFDRDATSWVYRGRVKPLDSANGNQPSGADYRGSLLITRSQDAQTHSESSPYLYWRNSGGNFDHVAVLGTGEGAHYMDVSGSRFVVQGQGDFGDITLRFFDLPLLNVVLTVYAGQVFGGPGSLGLMLGSFAAGSLAGTIMFGAIGRSLPRRRFPNA